MTGVLRTFQKQVSLRLIAWSAISILIGVVLSLSGAPFWRGVGLQAILWGAIDATIGAYGLHSARRFTSKRQTEAQERQASQRMSRLLWVNTGLDLLYILGGVILILTFGRSSPEWRGHGWGIIVQAVFLFVFDWQHALRVPPAAQPERLDVFPEDLHSTFTLYAGKPAALLVHGFPGTPLEMRPLAEALHEWGWTVQGLLLPGFGPELASLGQKRYEDWTAKIVETLKELRLDHDPVVLVGYSMGGALSVLASLETRPDGLVLLAPFLWKDSFAQHFLVKIAPYILPHYIRPMRFIFLANPQARSRINQAVHQAELGAGGVQQELDQYAFPIDVLNQVRKAGIAAVSALSRLDLPVLVVQGTQDPTVPVARTRRMLEGFSVHPLYVEVEAEHALQEPGPAFDELRENVLTFLTKIEEQGS
jgi:esterase/lipase